VGRVAWGVGRVAWGVGRVAWGGGRVACFALAAGLLRPRTGFRYRFWG